MEKKIEEVGKIIIVIMTIVFGISEPVEADNPNQQVINCGPGSGTNAPCTNPYSRNSASDFPAADFNCSDPNGLPCSEAYALQDVLEGLQLPSGSQPKVSRLDCNLSTDSISVTCACTSVSADVSECHVIYISSKAVDLSNGIIHENVSMLSHLEYLDLNSNNLHCKIPDSLGNLKFLRALYLYDNFLQGPIPSSIGNMTSLDDIDLSRNMLSGGIPDDIGKLSTRLLKLNIEENQLTGNLPKQLGNLINLRKLVLGSNFLDGVIDDNFKKLSSMETFQVNGNNLSGPIPEFISKWINLTVLDLMGNNFEGNLPLQIFKMPNLQKLRVSDLNNTEDFVIPEKANLTSINTLVLRNCNLTGNISQVIGNWQQLYRLDLSFNNLTGSIPDALQNVPVIVLTGNMLEGQIPKWLVKEKTERTDISYNNFSPNKISSNRKSNITNEPNISPTRNYIAELKNKHCDSLGYNLFINCGGGKQIYEGVQYEADTSLDKFYESETKRWAYSCNGNFESDSNNASNFIKNKTCGVSDQGLQETSRLCPVSLTYYAFCLRNGSYSVKLQFAELVFASDEDSSTRSKRVFDVYIQGERRLKDFNIKNESGEAYKATTREFVVHVMNNQLVIHFYWAGKGSFYNSPRLNGPLVSGISVSPNFPIRHKNLSPGEKAGITVGCVLAPVLLLAFLWRMGWLGNNELKKISVQVEENRYTLQQIVDATRRFNPNTNKIGEGRFGTVYKAELPTPNGKILLAVKRISPDVMQDSIKTELQDEIYNLKKLEHANVIKLYDGYSKKDLHLLIYEYMEKGSLHQAVLDPNPKKLLNWQERFNICLGLANALEHVHGSTTGLVILHRNIKASNILLDGNYNAKLTDFGWARLCDEGDPFVAIKAKSAREYMAPEFPRGQPITAKADVYSYGVVVLEVFSGRPCYQDKPNQESAYLLDDARTALAQRKMDKLVDPKMVNYDRKVVYNALYLAMECINHAANLRPTMSEVTSVLSGDKRLEDITKAHISEAGDTCSYCTCSRKDGQIGGSKDGE